jgi:hypothetical protein
MFRRAVARVTLALVMWLACSVQAQWLTQGFNLKAGWNAVYLHVDASHATLGELIASDAGNPILEVWMWMPSPSTLQYVTSPSQPVGENSQWLSWVRSEPGSSGLQRLVGNAAYLVRVGTNVTSSYSWLVRGRPVAPRVQWTTTGLNFLGFPSSTANPPTFEQFLSESTSLQQSAEIFQYVGGDLVSGVNPARVFNLRTARVNRGQAFWMRAGDLYNRFYGPFEVSLGGSAGVDFGTFASTYTVRLRNLTAAPLTMNLQLVASETPPSGQVAIAGVPPLIVRGGLDPAKLTYGSTNLPVGTVHSWVLAASQAPGSEVDVLLGLNRLAMTQPRGSLLAGVLRFMDAQGRSQVDVPVSATVGSSAGLWVGEAKVSEVAQSLKTYAKSATHPDELAQSTNGSYVVDSVNTNWGTVPRSYPLRLIVHNPQDAGSAVLLQRVFCGMDAHSNAVVARSEASLGVDFARGARRLSATHLPWSKANAGWSFDGRLDTRTNLLTTVQVGYADQASNPFLHTYHPDHDNLAADFKTVLPQGSESYTIRRDVALKIHPPAGDFASLTASTTSLSGEYVETIRLMGLVRGGGAEDTRQYLVRGVFTLTRLTDIPLLSP